MLVELIKGEHFVLADLFKLNLGSSSKAVSTQEYQAEATKETLVRSAWATQPQSPWPTPQLAKKKKENRTRTQKTKEVGAGLEDIVDRTGIISSEPTKEEEMSSLVTGFAVQMRKRATGSKGETTPRSGGIRSRRSSSNEEVKKDWAIISMDSPDRAPNDQLALEGVPNEASASLEEGILIGGPPNVNKIGEKVPSGVTATPVLPPRSTDTEPSIKRLFDQLLLNTYVPSYGRIHPPTGMVAPNLEGALEIIHCWSPFNQVESSVAHMYDLYPNNFLLLVAAHVEQYTISFPVYMDKEAF